MNKSVIALNTISKSKRYTKLLFYIAIFASSSVFISCDTNDMTETAVGIAATTNTYLIKNGLSKTAISKTNSYSSKTWMTALPDNLDIRQVSIPGTHDSGSKDLFDLAKCQDMSIQDQLNLGIRFLDLRFTPVGRGSFTNFSIKISHTFITSTDLKEVFRDVHIFLTNNPNETVLIKIARDVSASSTVPEVNNTNNTAFYKEYNLYKNNIKVENFLTQTLVAKAINESGLGSRISATAKIGLPIVLGDLRGKVVLFYDYSRFSSTFRKINTIAQGVYQDNYNGVQQLPSLLPSLLIQDFYQNAWSSSFNNDIKNKKALVQSYMNKRNALRLKNITYAFNGFTITNFSQKMPFSFNYLSISGMITTPKEYAIEMNNYFESGIIGFYSTTRFNYTVNNLKVNYRVGYGITLFDFPSSSLIKEVYNDNFSGVLEDVTLK